MVDMSVVERGMKNKQILAFVPASAFFKTHAPTKVILLYLPYLLQQVRFIYFYFLLCTGGLGLPYLTMYCRIAEVRLEK